MNIAFVSEHASPLATLGGADAGGQNVHVAALAVGLAALGANIVVYTRRDSPHLPHRVEYAPGVVVEHINAGPAEIIDKDHLLPYMNTFAHELERAWRIQRPDVAHAHFWMSGLATMQACRTMSIPFIHTYHALGTERLRHQGVRDTSPRERIAVEHDIALHADHIVATASAEAFELISMGADMKRITIVPCGVDVSLFNAPHAFRQDANPMRILCLSRLVERKGIADVIRALADVPNAELLIAGGPSREKLSSHCEANRLFGIAEQVGVGERVRFLGSVAHEAVPKLMRSSDVFVTYPWYEPFGIVPLEAMASGLPVVAARVGGLIDTIAHGKTGLLVAPHSPAELAYHLRILQDDPKLRQQFGMAGRNHVHERHDWKRIAADTLHVYMDLLRVNRVLVSGLAVAS